MAPEAWMATVVTLELEFLFSVVSMKENSRSQGPTRGGVDLSIQCVSGWPWPFHTLVMLGSWHRPIDPDRLLDN